MLRAAAVVTLAGMSGVATTAQAADAARAPSMVRVAASHCAKVTVKATPKVNTAMVAETVMSKVTNCSSASETVTLTQKISGPTFATGFVRTRTWKFTIPAGKSVTKTRSVPYACCGSYNVTDIVNSASGHRLAKASTGFTFA